MGVLTRYGRDEAGGRSGSSRRVIAIASALRLDADCPPTPANGSPLSVGQSLGQME